MCVQMRMHSVQEEKLPPAPMMRIMQINSPEWMLIVIGCLAALVMGCIQPAFAILFANMLGVSHFQTYCYA